MRKHSDTENLPCFGSNLSNVIPARAEREPGISRFPDAQLRI